jgi:hypothetical protein
VDNSVLSLFANRSMVWYDMLQGEVFCLLTVCRPLHQGEKVGIFL